MSGGAGWRRKVGFWALVLGSAIAILFVCYRLEFGSSKAVEQVEVKPAEGAVGPGSAAVAEEEPAPGTVEAIGDLDLPPKRPPPVSAEDDRGAETLLLGSERCLKLHESFQASVSGDGRCEVYLHDLTRQGDAILIMASPQYGVRANGRPIMTILPGSAYPRR